MEEVWSEVFGDRPDGLSRRGAQGVEEHLYSYMALIASSTRSLGMSAAPRLAMASSRRSRK